MGARIVTWNLWWRFGPWEERMAAIGAVLRHARPDICVLQEVWVDGRRNQAAVLAEAEVRTGPARVAAARAMARAPPGLIRRCGPRTAGALADSLPGRVGLARRARATAAGTPCGALSSRRRAGYRSPRPSSGSAPRNRRRAASRCGRSSTFSLGARVRSTRSSWPATSTPSPTRTRCACCAGTRPGA